MEKSTTETTPCNNMITESLPSRDIARQHIDSLIKSFIEEENSKLQNLLNEALFPGRRARPVIFFLLCGNKGILQEDVLDKLAISIEFFHRASIILDDFIDRDTMRRQRPTFHKSAGEKETVATSRFLVASAYKNLSDLPSNIVKDAFSLTNRAYENTILGELADIGEVEVESSHMLHYEQEVLGKTSSLFELSFSFAALVRNFDENQTRVMAEIGEKVGQLYQVYNDINDELFSSDDERGDKKLWKINYTLPLCLLLDNISEDEKYKITSLVGKEITQKDYHSLREKMRTEEIRQSAKKYGENLSSQLNTLLGKLSEPEIRKTILDIHNIIKKRIYWDQKEFEKAGY